MYGARAGHSYAAYWRGEDHAQLFDAGAVTTKHTEGVSTSIAASVATTATSTASVGRRPPSCVEYAQRQRGWKCRRRVEPYGASRTRAPTAPHTFERLMCGSRLTSLPADVVNSTREFAAIKAAERKLGPWLKERREHATAR